jgi:hypothetical protein
MIATWAISQNCSKSLIRESPLGVPRVSSLKLLLIVTSAGPAARPRRHKRHEVVRAPSRRTTLQPGFLGRKAARRRRSPAHYGMLPLRCAAGTHAQTDDNLRMLCCCTQRERERERILRGFWESSSGRQWRKLLQQRRWIRRSRSRTVYSLYTSA